MRKSIFALLMILVLLVSVSLAEKTKITREYFENLDKESTLEDIVNDIGQCGIEGSGIIYYVWHLDDGSRAKVVFNSKGRIYMIYITGENGSERIYNRLDQEAGPGKDHPEDTENTVTEEDIQKMEKAIGESLPASARMPLSVTDKRIRLFDITGDGRTELCTCITWGSGMVRTDLVVYDPAEEKLYVLDGYNYNYLIDRVEEDRIVIVMEGPHGYGDPITKTYGTVKLENDQLVFTPDSEGSR